MRALREQMTTKSGWTYQRALLYEIFHPQSRRPHGGGPWAGIVLIRVIGSNPMRLRGSRIRPTSETDGSPPGYPEWRRLAWTCRIHMYDVMPDGRGFSVLESA